MSNKITLAEYKARKLAESKAKEKAAKEVKRRPNLVKETIQPQRIERFARSDAAFFIEMELKYSKEYAMELRSAIVPFGEVEEKGARFHNGVVSVQCGIIGILPNTEMKKDGSIIEHDNIHSWRPTVKVSINGLDESISLKCKSAGHMQQVYSACCHVCNSFNAMALNWRSAISKAIQPFYKGFEVVRAQKARYTPKQEQSILNEAMAELFAAIEAA